MMIKEECEILKLLLSSEHAGVKQVSEQFSGTLFEKAEEVPW